jgi:hypothetical protein
MRQTVKINDLVLLVTLVCVEELCSIMNLVSLERD